VPISHKVRLGTTIHVAGAHSLVLYSLAPPSLPTHRLVNGVKAQAHDEDLCHQGAVQCDKAGRITDLVLQGTDMETDLSCTKFSTGFAKLPKLQRLDLAGAKLGRCLAGLSCWGFGSGKNSAYCSGAIAAAGGGRWSQASWVSRQD
jgi:hypothetical protein